MKILQNSILLVLLLSSLSLSALSRRTYNEQYNNDLFRALEKNSLGDVETLLRQGANPNAKKDGKTALMVAIAYDNNGQMVEVLLKGGADANAIDSSLMSPLEFATYYEKDPKIIHVLLQHGARITSRVNLGYSPGQTKIQKEDPYALARKELKEWEILPSKEELAEEQAQESRSTWAIIKKYLGF